MRHEGDDSGPLNNRHREEFALTETYRPGGLDEACQGQQAYNSQRLSSVLVAENFSDRICKVDHASLND